MFETNTNGTRISTDQAIEYKAPPKGATPIATQHRSIYFEPNSAKMGLLAAEVSEACSAKPLGDNPYALKPPHFKPRAKAVISLFMTGGPSAIDDAFI